MNLVEARKLPTHGVQEVLAAEVKLRGADKQLILAIYRSPNSTKDNNDSLTNLMRELNQCGYSHILALGDFNFPEIKWNNGGAVQGNSPSASSFIDAVNDSFMFQHVDFPTHHRENQTANILDLIFTNEESMVEELTSSSPLGKSDHAVLNFRLRCYTEVSELVKCRHLYNKADFDKMKTFMLRNWHDEFADKTTEEKWQLFLDRLSLAIKQFIPEKEIVGGKSDKPLWLNQGTIRSIRRKHKAWIRLQESRTTETSLKYARARNQARWATRKAVKEYEKSIAMNIKSNPKMFWQYVHSRTKTRQLILDLEKSDGTLRQTDIEKAEVLNTFFTSVFTREDMTNIPHVDKQNVLEGLQNIKITEEDVQKRLSKLKTSKSPGPDGLHPRVLKELSQTIAEPLKMLFQSALEEGVLPNDWRVAHVSPIYKKGAKTNAGNYRPVSLTSVICKVMEGFVRDQVVAHMTANNLFTPHQHGFVAGRSTVTQLLETIEYWSEAIDDGTGVDIAYLDFQKAFDSVPHKRLLRKLKSYGIAGNVYNWIEAFLSNCKQCVIINGAKSGLTAAVSGIPQGSVSGPILFTIFISDMPLETICPIKLFADDAKLYYRVENISDCQQIQDDLIRLREWSNRWQLKFHSQKMNDLESEK